MDHSRDYSERVGVLADMQVPFVNLSRQHNQIEAELGAGFERVVREGGFTLGPEVDSFEQEFASFVGTADSIGVASGTDALHLTLRAMGVGPGDEVITAVNTFAATAEAIVMCGATPVFSDVDEKSCLMDLDSAEAAVTDRTKVILPVHLYGQMVDMREVRHIANRHGLRVIEDACQAHGARANGESAGAASDAGCFSFYPSKNLGALGDGGAVTTDDAHIADQVRLLRSHGEDKNRLHVVSGYCSRLHGMQAAFLRAKLPHLSAWNESRQRSAALYEELLAGTGVIAPQVMPGREHVFHLYVVRVPDRDSFRSYLAERGVQTGVHYPVPLHLEPAFSYLGYQPGAFPVAEKLTSQIVSLPMFPHMTTTEVEYVAETAAAALEQLDQRVPLGA